MDYNAFLLESELAEAAESVVTLSHIYARVTLKAILSMHESKASSLLTESFMPRVHETIMADLCSDQGSLI